MDFLKSSICLLVSNSLLPVRTFLAEPVYIFNIISYSISKPLEAVVVILLLPAPRRACNKIFGSLVQILQQVLLIVLHFLEWSLLLLGLSLGLSLRLLGLSLRLLGLSLRLRLLSLSLRLLSLSLRLRLLSLGLSLRLRLLGLSLRLRLLGLSLRLLGLSLRLLSLSLRLLSLSLRLLSLSLRLLSLSLRLLVQPILLGKVVKCDSSDVSAQFIAHAHPAVFGTPRAHVGYRLANFLAKIIEQLFLSIRPLAVNRAEVGHALAVYMDILYRYERSFGVARVDRNAGRGCRGREIISDKSVIVIKRPTGLAGAVTLTELVQYIKRFLCSS